MENQTEQVEAQNVQQGEVDTVQLTSQELADLKHKAEVSSQNFERAKKAEAALKELEANKINEVPTDDSLKSEIQSIKEKLAKQETLEAHPELKDKWKDFEEFRSSDDNRGMNMKTAAKAFLVENGFLETRRTGLEQKTGGERTGMKTEITYEEAEELRKNNHKLYQEKLMKGEFPWAR